MGNMKTFWLFGFERWGIKPEVMWTKEGKCFKALYAGIWIRWPFLDKGDE